MPELINHTICYDKLDYIVLCVLFFQVIGKDRTQECRPSQLWSKLYFDYIY